MTVHWPHNPTCPHFGTALCGATIPDDGPVWPQPPRLIDCKPCRANRAIFRAACCEDYAAPALVYRDGEHQVGPL